MSEAALAEDPDVLGVELTGRLLSHFHSHANIRQLITQCDMAAPKRCPVVPNWQVRPWNSFSSNKKALL